MKKIVYQKNRLGNIQQWSIWVEENGNSGFPEVWVEHGLQDGKKQTTYDIVDKGVNEGKANETTPLQQAELLLERRLKKQLECGYFESIEDAMTVNDIYFNVPFPKNLCFYKPNNSIEPAKISKLEKNKQALYVTKRDGMMHIIRKSDSLGVEIYSRRMDLVSDKYPHLIDGLNKLPLNTILLGEMILENPDGTDNFNGVSQICRSDPATSIQRQEELGKVKYYVFDIAFMEGECLLTSYGFGYRSELLIKLLKEINDPCIVPVEVIKANHSDALDIIKKRKLEGLVVWDSESKMQEGQAFTFSGKPYRPRVVWKSKPKYEDDFVADWDAKNNIGDYGKGKNKNKMGNVYLFQLDEDGNKVFVSKCGGGFTDKQRDFYTTAKFPRVFKVEYDSVQPGTGALRFPVFASDRTLIGDKDVSECLMGDDIKQARKNNTSILDDE